MPITFELEESYEYGSLSQQPPQRSAPSRPSGIVMHGWQVPLGSTWRRWSRLQPGAACPAPPPTP